MALSISASAWAGVCLGKPYIRSRLILSKPASRAMLSAVSACAPSWMRPSACRQLLSKLCMPIDNRFMPALLKSANLACSKVPGLASIVISIDGGNAVKARTPLSSRSIASALNKLGVPPPINTECIARPQISGISCSRSASSASMYCVSGRDSSRCWWELKSQ